MKIGRITLYLLFVSGVISIQTAFADTTTTDVQTQTASQTTDATGITTKVKITHHHRYKAHAAYPAGQMTVTFYPGSLRANIKRIATQYGWQQVSWNAPYDYDWVGTTRIQGADLEDILQKVLADFPLQAVFYEGNKVLAIQPRSLR